MIQATDLDFDRIPTEPSHQTSEWLPWTDKYK